nr:proteoglycan 4-like [Arachis hypogaea]
MMKNKGKYKDSSSKKHKMDLSKVTCHHCKEVGHFKLNCPKLKKEDKGKKKKKRVLMESWEDIDNDLNEEEDSENENKICFMAGYVTKESAVFNDSSMKSVASSSNTKSTSNKSSIGYVPTLEEKIDEVYTSETEPPSRIEPTSIRLGLGYTLKNELETTQMKKKTAIQKPPPKKIYKLPAKPKPSTRSQDRTFTPSPSPPTSPPRSDPMACTKNPSRFTPSAKPMPPPKEPPPKPRSSKPSSSKGKCPATAEPTSEPTQPKTRSVPLHSQRVKQQKGPTRFERVVLDDEDDEFIPEESQPPSTEGTSISTRQKSTLFNVVRDVVQEFFSQSNHMIAMSKEQRKLASKHENFLRKSRNRVAYS